MNTVDAKPPRYYDYLIVGLCCIATFILKVWANDARQGPGHGDTCYYFHVAENLFSGRGFVCDYIWSFLENNDGQTPAPSNAWWMPGPSILAFLGMWTAGSASYAAAKLAMITATSLYPLIVWLTAIQITKDRVVAARAVILSTAFHPFIDQPSAPLSHGPYGIIVGGALILLASGPLTVARGAILGLLIALGHYFRGDALTLFGTAGTLALFHARRAGFINVVKPLGIAIVVYLVAMSPWFVRNVSVFGAPLPPGPGKALYMRDYTDWFALPDRLDRQHYLADGFDPILAEKVEQTKKSLWSFVASYFDPTLSDLPGTVGQSFRSFYAWASRKEGPAEPGLPPPWLFLRHVSIAMAFATFGGIILLMIRGIQKRAVGWLGVYGLHSFAEIVFYALLFTGVANQSYISSLYSLYPLFVVGIVAFCDPMRSLGLFEGRPAALAGGILAWILVAGLVVVNAAGIGCYLRTNKGPTYHRNQKEYIQLGEKLRAAGFNPSRDRAMMAYTWNLHAAAGIPTVRIPDEPLSRILMTAKRMKVNWLLIQDPPTDAEKAGIPPKRRYRLEIYNALKLPEYFWHAFDAPALNLHAVRISQRALDEPWKVK